MIKSIICSIFAIIIFIINTIFLIRAYIQLPKQIIMRYAGRTEIDVHERYDIFKVCQNICFLPPCLIEFCSIILSAILLYISLSGREFYLEGTYAIIPSIIWATVMILGSILSALYDSYLDKSFLVTKFDPDYFKRNWFLRIIQRHNSPTAAYMLGVFFLSFVALFMGFNIMQIIV